MVDRADMLALIAATIYDDANRDVDKELDRCMEIARGLLDRASSLAAEKAEEPAPTASACPSCDDAWGLIANAHGGDWSKASEKWRAAATRWRDAWMSSRPTASAQGGPTPTLEECQRAAIEAMRERHPNASELALLLSPDEAAQVAAVRALCLASRARDASWRIEVRGSQPQCWVVVDPSGEAGEQSFTVGPCFDADEREDAEHFARMTRTALERLASRAPSSRLVEAADAMRAYFDETTLTMNRIRDKEAPGLMWALTEEYVDGATPLLAAYDSARAEHERSVEK